MLRRMNLRHQEMLLWVREFYSIPASGAVLDIGCGGGRNLANMLEQAPGATFSGIDLSPQSVRQARAFNRAAVRSGRIEIRKGSVEKLPYPDAQFDLATASETIYFWPDLAKNFREVCRVLKPGGMFLICNEVPDSEDGRKWTGIIDGMRVYSNAELEMSLTGAGFGDLAFHTHTCRTWLCVTARRK